MVRFGFQGTRKGLSWATEQTIAIRSYFGTTGVGNFSGRSLHCRMDRIRPSLGAAGVNQFSFPLAKMLAGITQGGRRTLNSPWAVRSCIGLKVHKITTESLRWPRAPTGMSSLPQTKG